MNDKVRRETNIRRKLWTLAFVVVSVFCLIFFAAQGRFETPVINNAVALVTAPFQSVISWVANELLYVRNTIWDIYAVHEQNKQLRAEVAELRVQNLQATEFAAENERLRALLQYKQTVGQFDLLMARVIGRESATWSSIIIINCGSTDGVKDNMAVVTEKGLVGHVTEVNLTSSKVQLLLDPRSSVGTLVQRPASRVAGIVEGDSANPFMPHMVNIPRNSDVVEGDTVVTSGFGGIYPKGIYVGKIASIKNDEGGLLKYGAIETGVDFQKLEDVAVIIASREAPPAPLTPVPQTPGTETKPGVNP